MSGASLAATRGGRMPLRLSMPSSAKSGPIYTQTDLGATNISLAGINGSIELDEETAAWIGLGAVVALGLAGGALWLWLR